MNKKGNQLPYAVEGYGQVVAHTMLQSFTMPIITSLSLKTV